MSLLGEPARISLVAGSSATGCELCTAQSVTPTTTVVISHPRGGIVQLAACDWCVQAVRRLAAASGGQAAFAFSEVGGPPPSTVRTAPPATRPLTPPVLIIELAQELQDSAGINYVIRVFGRERVDGRWEGFLEFVAVGAAIVLRTGTETTQSNREDLAYWASGLNTAYLQGAFARAQRYVSTTP
jgi:hypothetical protein